MTDSKQNWIDMRVSYSQNPVPHFPMARLQLYGNDNVGVATDMVAAT